MNASDTDAEKWIKIFTFLSKTEVDFILNQHKGNEHQRLLQKKLAEKITSFVHGDAEFIKAKKASEFIFGSETDASFLHQTDEKTFLEVFSSVPLYNISMDKINMSINVIDFLVETGILLSKGEAKKLIQNGGISINRWKVDRLEYPVQFNDILLKKYILVQKGKKNYYLVKVI